MENAQVKHLVRLMEKAKYRSETGLFVTEGVRMAREVPPEDLEAVYLSAHFEETYPADAAALSLRSAGCGAKYELLSDSVFARISGTVTPQGVLCVVKRRTAGLPEMLEGHRPLHLILLENLQDPGNLGTILRTGEAAGISGIIADHQTADLYNPKTVRATMGAVFRVPYAVVPDAAEAAEILRAAGVCTAATAPLAETAYTDADFTGDTAFLIGNEGNGLSGRLLEKADIRLRIPMEGQAESLNAAVAAALCMYEAKRQRDLQKKHTDS